MSIVVLVLMFVTSGCATTPAPNNPPNTPVEPSGSDSGYTDISYTYSTSATDTDNDEIKYIFDWGDSTTSETEFVSSGTI